ncbi:unnamed protein product [Caenorhabditis auriculariae]|uniref:Transducer of regulated CREB activity N-terminal domain-containing protein n=1 Tax=Caenorhabditis auriculariae TaxID=2777116 RepID=A0A8S1H659_9PELO|nr:unnamed protein product [Caenorhabditis auriculariae]
MRMSSSGGTPRKFSEKIAIIERKQNEDVNNFEDIMREVRSITHDGPSDSQPLGGPMAIPGGLHPPQPWNSLGGSLPNVHQMPSYQPPPWAPWPHEMSGRPVGDHRSRSPEHHPGVGHLYHPYGRGQRSPDRVPPLHPHYGYPPHQHNLLQPDNWNQINRARSDPAIHNMPMPPPPLMPHHPPFHHHPFMPGPSGMHQGMPPPNQQNSPLQSPVMNNQMMHPMYGFPPPNGSPLQSPMGSPHGSSLMLDGRTTPMMELSPPGMHDFQNEAGSLPNLQQTSNGHPGPQYYHQTVGQRHSTATCGPRLAPGPVLTPESQSAPTSPHNSLDPNAQPQWPTRTFSNSPESLDIPKLVLTNAEGAPGQQLECFNDLQHLTLDANDMNLLCNGDAQPDLHEPQLLQN